jgi:glycerol-3-phosphate dehydrogenase (NAD(P)+)
MKNVLAIGCGIAAGLNLGQNIQSALLTQGIKEMGYLAEVKGGKRETLLELCGIGDAVLTCLSMESRNASFGYKLGQGQSIESVISESKAVTEGFATAKSIYNLSKLHGLSLNLCTKIYDILYNKHPVESIILQI